MTLANDDGPSNGGAEAVRVACRFWDQDVRRAIELDQAIRRDLKKNLQHNRGKVFGARRPRKWTCPGCGRINRDTGWCRGCQTVKP